MKKSFSRIWGVGLVLVMLASLLFSVVPVAADELAWGSYSLPSTTSNILVTTPGLDIVDVAVGGDGNTMYVATAAVDNRVYKSTDGGKTWGTVGTTNLPNPANLVAVAPDSNDIVVVAGGASNLTIAVSTNAGSTWSTISPVTEAANTATTVFDVAISALSGSSRMIGVASDSTAGESDDPSLFYFNLGSAVPAWTDAVLNASWDAGAGLGLGFAVAADPANWDEIDSIQAIAFSPYFASDQTAVVVSNTTGSAVITGTMAFHILSFNQKKWNSTAGFTGYPYSIKSASAAAAVFGVNNADISLDPSYLGGDDSLRVAFVGASITSPAATEMGGIFRLKDTSVKALLETTGIKSVAWNGINLVAGPTLTNTVKYSADALATSPSVSSASVFKRPGLDATNTNAVVRWAGANVVGATSGNGSAFAISTDNGKTFNDVSLIDATLTAIEDLLVAPDGSKVYFLSRDAARTSLWVKTDRWWRVWQANDINGYIIRAAPDNKDILYIADQGASTSMWFTDSGGMTKWFPRSSRYNIQDLAVESADVAYVAENATGSVSKTTNKGFTWGDSKSASLGAGNCNSITVIGKDKLLVGSTLGYVSYSADGNANWTKLDKVLAIAGNTVVTASSLDSGGYVYAGTIDAATQLAKVQRWQIGTSTSWKDLAAPGLPYYLTATPTVAVAEMEVRGIALAEGVLYVLAFDTDADAITTPADAINSGILRTLNPTDDAPGWSTMDLGSAILATLAPSALRTSLGSTTLWAVDTAGVKVYSYQDTLSTAKVVLAGPADGGKVSVNLISGTTYGTSFSWTRPSKATIYDLQVALDSGFNEKIVDVSTAATTSGTIASFQAGANFNPDTKYYWRVRVNSAGPIRSNWSDVRNFTIAAATVTPPVVVTQAPPAPVPVINLPAPIINLPAPTTITIPPAPIITIPPAPAPPAPVAPAYIWAVVIIGAILVIAVIILIVRTRRPV